MVGGSFGGFCGCQRWIKRVLDFVWSVVVVANGYVPVFLLRRYVGGLWVRGEVEGVGLGGGVRRLLGEGL